MGFTCPDKFTYLNTFVMQMAQIFKVHCITFCTVKKIMVVSMCGGPYVFGVTTFPWLPQKGSCLGLTQRRILQNGRNEEWENTETQDNWCV